MKNIRYSIVLLCMVAIALFNLFSCQRITEGDAPPVCGNQPDEYYYLSETQKQRFPYSGFDTINLASNMGDTLNCIGTGKQYSFVHELRQDPNPACGNQGTDMYYETYKSVFTDSITKMDLVISHYFKHFVLNGPEYSHIEVFFQSKSIYVYDSQISSPKAQIYIGDVEINNKIYKDVSKSRFTNSAINDNASFLLINRQNGIIQIQLNPNEIWTIID